MKEFDAPESKRTVAGVEWTSNGPSITSGFSTVVSWDKWFTLLVLGAGFW
jgi:hypothetical protein